MRKEDFNREMSLKSVKFKLALFGSALEGQWEPNEAERKAAWEMYTELVTRISVAELRADEGSLKEALSSLHKLFEITREILKKHGPTVAQLKKGNNTSFGYLAVNILNLVLRPVLATWHPLLEDYAHHRDSAMSEVEHERHWDRNTELRAEFNRVRLILLDYAEVLAEVAEVPMIYVEREGVRSGGEVSTT